LGGAGLAPGDKQTGFACEHPMVGGFGAQPLQGQLKFAQLRFAVRAVAQHLSDLQPGTAVGLFLIFSTTLAGLHPHRDMRPHSFQSVRMNRKFWLSGITCGTGDHAVSS
ncbi:MAG TPA: hypothetical protein PLE66_01760, partial [Thauera aminoaromatica]|nr:hypothetical protein [Thauera aminoaromatica]